MTYRQIETSRERRLWLTQVAIPVVTLALTAMSIPEVKNKAVEKFNDVRDKLKKFVIKES